MGIRKSVLKSALKGPNAAESNLDGGAGTNLTEDSDETVCRICWLTENETEIDPDHPDDINPLISPCKCTGTMRAIHLKCLRGWLE